MVNICVLSDLDWYIRCVNYKGVLRSILNAIWIRSPEALRGYLRRNPIVLGVSALVIEREYFLDLDDGNYTKNVRKKIFDSNIDVVVTCYRQTNYLNECLKSVLSQDVKLETITVINHCTDEQEILNFQNVMRFYQQDERIIPKYLDETWPGETRNIGFNQGVASYVLFIDADDWINSSYLSNALLLLISTDSDFVGANCEIFSDDGVLGVWRLKKYPTIKNLVRANAFPVASLVKREVVEQIGGWNDFDFRGLRQDEAIDFWRRAVLSGHQGSNIDQQLLHIRRHPSNLSTRESSLITAKSLRRSYIDLVQNLPRKKLDSNSIVFFIPSIVEIFFAISTYKIDNDKKTIIFLAADGTLFGAGKVLKDLIDQCLADDFNVIVLNCDYSAQGSPLSQLLNVPWIEFGSIIPRPHWLQTLQMWFDEIGPAWVISMGHTDVDLVLNILKIKSPEFKLATTLFNTQSMHAKLLLSNPDTYDKVLVESQASHSWALSEGLHRDSLEIMRHTAHRLLFSPTELPGARVQNHNLVIGWFHRFSQEKQPFEFLKIANEIRSDKNMFLMGGVGPLRESVQKATLKLDITLLSESVSTREFLQAVDVTILTSSEVEGRPLAILEALEYGKVVLSLRVGALEEILRLGYQGFFLFDSSEEIINFLKFNHELVTQLKAQQVQLAVANKKITDDYVRGAKRITELLC